MDEMPDERYRRAIYLRETCEKSFLWSERGMVSGKSDMWYIRGPEAMELIKHLQDELTRADEEADARVQHCVSGDAALRKNLADALRKWLRKQGGDVDPVRHVLAYLSQPEGTK